MILLTGASGFVGQAVVARLQAEGSMPIVVAVRQLSGHWLPNVSVRLVGDLATLGDWSAAIEGVKVIVHCAARVHVMKDLSIDPLAEFRRINVEGTLNIARQAANMGVERFVYLSSIKVNGEVTQAGKPFTSDGNACPQDAYGISKMEAEVGLRELAGRTAMDVVIIRSPLVYGPGVKGNFAVMMKWLNRGVPLPFGAIHNQRSLVAVENLADLIAVCINHPRAVNETFLVSDGEDISTTELLLRLSEAMGQSARLLPVPVGLLRLATVLLGRREVAQRICGWLQVDITKTKDLLNWKPPLTLNQGLSRVATSYVHETHH